MLLITYTILHFLICTAHTLQEMKYEGTTVQLCLGISVDLIQRFNRQCITNYLCSFLLHHFLFEAKTRHVADHHPGEGALLTVFTLMREQAVATYSYLSPRKIAISAST